MTHAVATSRESKAAPVQAKRPDARPEPAAPSAGVPLFLQHKCACGGSCASCAARDETLQKKENGSASHAHPSGPSIHGVARGGVETANEPLPHLEQIQTSFGRHDVSGIRTATGGGAADANDRMGSVGYTVGDRIGFRSSPDVRLAAHEATHALQQRSGVQLDDGVGHPGDPYEAHADHVADAVERGESAEPILDRGPDGGRGASAGAGDPVQHQLSVNATRLFEAGAAMSEAPAGGGGAGEAAGGEGGEAEGEEAAAEESAAPEDADAAAEADASEEAAAAGGEGEGGGGAPAGGGETTATEGAEGACTGGTEAQCYRGETEEPDPEPEEQPPNPAATQVEEQTSDEGEEDLPEPDDCPTPEELAAQAGQPTGEGAGAAPAAGPPAQAATSEAALTSAVPETAALSSAGGGGGGGGSRGGGGGGGGAGDGGAALASPIDAAIAGAEAGRSEAVGAYALSSATLAGAAAATSDLRGGVSFGASVGGENQGLVDAATGRTDRFFSDAADQIDVAIEFALYDAPDQLGAQAEAAKGEIAASIEIQKLAISERIQQARGSARASAAMARREVTAQADAFMGDVEAGTLAAIDSLTGTHAETMGQVNELETATLDSLNQTYADGRADLEGLGPLVGNECVATGTRFATAYRRFRNPNCTENGFWDGDLAERRSMAQEEAATKTAQGYHDRMVESARKRAREVVRAGRKQDRCAVINAAASARSTLDQQLDALVSTLETVRMQTIDQAGSARDAILSSIDGALASTLRQLDRQEHDQRQAANDTGYMQQVLQEQVAHAGAASLQDSVAGAAAAIHATLFQLREQFAIAGPPDPVLLDEALSGVTQRLDTALGGLRTTLAGGTAVASEQLALVAQEGLAALDGVTQSNDEMAGSVSDGFAASMSQIAGTDNFATQRDGFTQVVQQSVDAGGAALAQAFDGFSEGCDLTLTEAEGKLDQAYVDLEANLRQSQQGLECDITSKATEAAASEAPAWKMLVAILLVIIVIVIVIAVTVLTAGGALAALGPLATIAVGAAIGAAVGAVTSGLLAIASNLWNNRTWTEGVGEAILVGAVTGALGGAIGAGAGLATGMIFQGASRAVQVGAQFVAAMVTAGGLDVVTQYVMGGLSWENFSWTNLVTTLVITAITFGIGHRVATARQQAPPPPPGPRRMGTVTADGLGPPVEHAPSNPVVERVPPGARRGGARVEPEASASPTRPTDTPEPAARRGSTSEEIQEVIAEETATSPEAQEGEFARRPDTEIRDLPETPEPAAERPATDTPDRPATDTPERPATDTPERPATDTPEAPPTPEDIAARKQAQTDQELEAELGRRDLLDDPMFEGMDPQTRSKVNTALKGDPFAKTAPETQLRAQEWARGGAGDNPREFANRYEYARARYSRARADAAARLKGSQGARAAAQAEAEAAITPSRLDQQLAADIATARAMGPGEGLGDIAVSLPPDATPTQIAAEVQKLNRFGFETETAEAYHAVKHAEEVPPALRRTGDPVRDYAAAAADTIQTGRVVRALAGDGSTLVIIQKAYGTPPQTLEAIVYVGRDGRVTLASYGRAKAVR